MTRDVLCDRVEKNLGGIAADTDFARVLQTGRLVRRTIETHDTAGTLRKDGEVIHAIIERGGSSIPVLLVIIAFRQRPDFIPPIVDPAAICLIRRNVLA